MLKGSRLLWRDWGYLTAGKVHALHAAALGLIPNVPYGPPSIMEEILSAESAVTPKHCLVGPHTKQNEKDFPGNDKRSDIRSRALRNCWTLVQWKGGLRWVVDLGSIPQAPYALLSPPGVIPEFRLRSKS